MRLGEEEESREEAEEEDDSSARRRRAAAGDDDNDGSMRAGSCDTRSSLRVAVRVPSICVLLLRAAAF